MYYRSDEQRTGGNYRHLRGPGKHSAVFCLVDRNECGAPCGEVIREFHGEVRVSVVACLAGIEIRCVLEILSYRRRTAAALLTAAALYCEMLDIA